MIKVASAVLLAALFVGCAPEAAATRQSVIDGHGIGSPIACPLYWCDKALAAVEAAVSRPIANLSWHDEIFFGPDGDPIGIDVGGLQQPVGVAVITMDDGSVAAISLRCGPKDCVAVP